MKNILLVNGHPNPKSFNTALLAAYRKGAESTKDVILSEIHVAQLAFNPNLAFGYKQKVDMEPDLTSAIELLKKADHIVWFSLCGGMAYLP